MIEIKLIPETACLVLKLYDEIIDYKFYNKLVFDHGDIDDAQIEADTQAMINDFLKTHISDMLSYYSWCGRFDDVQAEIFVELADHTKEEIGKLIKKFDRLNTKIMENRRTVDFQVPVLKQILQLL